MSNISIKYCQNKLSNWLNNKNLIKLSFSKLVQLGQIKLKFKQLDQFYLIPLQINSLVSL